MGYGKAIPNMDVRTTKQPRARGAVRLRFERGNAGTRLSGLHQSGSLRALFPRGGAKALQAVLTNTSGGVTGGDRFETEIVVDAGARATLTTQAAERAYRAQPGQVGRIRTRASVAGGGRLNWLPQETILFDGCDLDRRIEVALEADGSLLLVEPLVFGRTAMGEVVRQGRFCDHVEISRGGRLVFLDRVLLDGDIAAVLDRPAIAAGGCAAALVVFVDASAERRLDAVRAGLPEAAGVSLIAPDIMVMRLVAQDGFALRAGLLPAIDALHDEILPRPWMI